MPGVPAFILRRLYVSGSLKNNKDGWQFTFKNSLGSGHATALLPLKLDQTEEIPMSQTTFESDGTVVSFDQVHRDNVFGLRMNREITINVIGEQLLTGAHQIDFACVVPGIGQIGFDFTDEVTNR